MCQRLDKPKFGRYYDDFMYIPTGFTNSVITQQEVDLSGQKRIAAQRCEIFCKAMNLQYNYGAKFLRESMRLYRSMYV